MPELPEVETLRLALLPLEGDILRDLICHKPAMLVAPPPPRPIRGSRLLRLSRHGKHLLLNMSPPAVLDVHLGMSGHLGWGATPHTRLTLVWSHHPPLYMNDPRMFGRIRIWPDEQTATAGLGPDALSTPDILEQSLCSKSARPTKNALMDQSILAGLGNIYTDEALWGAGIHPTRPLSSLSPQERIRLAETILTVLRQGIQEGGTTLKDYRNPQGQPGSNQFRLQVYGRAGKPCLICGTLIERFILAGRSTHFCPGCQPLSFWHKAP